MAITFTESPRTGSAIRPRRGRDACALADTPATRAGVFVVDDDEAICTTIVLALRTQGIEAQERPPRSNSPALDERPCCSSFLDIALKNSDAIDVLRELGEKSYTGTVQLMSGSDRGPAGGRAPRGVEHGLNIDRPSTKPFRLETIRQAVDASRCRARPGAPATPAGPG